MVKAALAGKLDHVGRTEEPVFKLAIPKECPGVPGRVLQPRSAWKDPSAYDAKAGQLLALFEQNLSSIGAASSELVATAKR